MKKAILYLLIATAIIAYTPECNAQLKADFGFGADFKTSHPVFKLSAGYEVKKVLIEIVEQPNITREVNAPKYFGARAGYNFGAIIPSIGYYYNYYNADDKQKNKWVGLGYSVKYVYMLGEQGGLFVEALYLNKGEQLIYDRYNMIKTLFS